MKKEFVVQMSKVNDSLVVDMYELPQVYAPLIRLYCAPWYDPEEDEGALAMRALSVLHEWFTMPEEEIDSPAE